MLGDFGTSVSARQPVSELVLSRLPATLELSIVALVIAVLIGGTMALTGTRFRGSKTEGAIDVSAGMALSIPDFLWGLGPVEIHRVRIIVAPMWIMASKLVSVLQARIAIRLNSLSF